MLHAYISSLVYVRIEISVIITILIIGYDIIAYRIYNRKC